MKILITCPPMINRIDKYNKYIKSIGFEYYCPIFEQVLTEEELIDLVPNYDGWIIGDDPATRKVLEAGIKGNLKAVVKWGVGVDNVDFDACKDLNIPVCNTPGMFGNEVADIAIGYLICLARQLTLINKKVRDGEWYKPCGITLKGKKVCLIGFGDIGRQTAKRLLGFDMNINVVDPGFNVIDDRIVCTYNKNIIIENYLQNVQLINNLSEALSGTDFIIVTCSLNKSTFHLLNKDNMRIPNRGYKIINISRGPVIDEKVVIELQKEGIIDSVAFDVFEEEPLSINNELRNNEKNIFGSHNGSNTEEAVDRTSNKAINFMRGFLLVT